MVSVNGTEKADSVTASYHGCFVEGGWVKASIF